MATESPPSWAFVGQRVATARNALERSLDWLAERSAISAPELQRLETGQSEFRPAQLSRIANALGLGVDWFVSESPPAVRSLRADRIETPSVARADLLLEGMARDVNLLRTLGTLPASTFDAHLPAPSDGEMAESSARTVRTWLGGDMGPLLDLDRIADRLGLSTLCVTMTERDPDGAHVALDSGGVAIINGIQEPGRRRFTLAHEIGHHVFQDKYSYDWIASSEESEKLINAFAVHLLLPRDSVTARWHRLRQTDEPRPAALRMAAEYRVSWSTFCTQCVRLRLIEQSAYDALRDDRPTRSEYIELGVQIPEEMKPPSLSPAFSRAVLVAYRKNRITGHRAIEMLRGTLDFHELPPSDTIPLAAYSAELETP